MQDLIFDHYTIKVTDLDASVQFYKRVLGLEEITNRTEKSYIRWISMGDRRELHIVEGDTSQISTDVGVHLALRLHDFDSFLDHLKKHNIRNHSSKGEPDQITIRADGIRQVYFQDLDGYWIEVNEASILEGG